MENNTGNRDNRNRIIDGERSGRQNMSRKAPSESNGERKISRENSSRYNQKRENISRNSENGRVKKTLSRSSFESAGRMPNRRKKKISLQTILLLVILAFILLFVVIFWKFQFGGIKLEYDPNYTPEISLDAEDIVLLPHDENGELISQEGATDILCIGNDVFSDDRDNDTSLAKMIENNTNVKVYNASFPETTVALSIPGADGNVDPADFFSFSKVAKAISTGDYSEMESLASNMGDAYVKGLDTLKSVDMSKVGTICIMYDGSDYLKNRMLYAPDDVSAGGAAVVQGEHTFNTYTYLGALIDGMQNIHKAYPKVRIVMNTFTYCRASSSEGSDENGDLYSIGNGTLVDYFGRLVQACESENVTMIDNYDGFITTDNYKEYLTDSKHLAPKARQYVAYHFAYIVFNKDKDKGNEEKN
ncbi:hypothetical protein [Butyrivibrio sp. NC3005]|uniref:hypothetical protein n=1 Tax=Butyrivibrio sp. NC3005 TaxID=1280685 RepID=UPI0004121327|nr:hypothetical protein [Butyrivibrio sp. NC3005]